MASGTQGYRPEPGLRSPVATRVTSTARRQRIGFFWTHACGSSFRIAHVRSGPAPTPITREAYSHEVTSAGFWPGTLAQGASAIDAAFYAYASPEPPGYKSARVIGEAIAGAPRIEVVA